MTDVTTEQVKLPRVIVSKAVIYLALLLIAMASLIGASLWLYNQQANKAEFLKQQQIPFIKNNAQLMKSVAELENSLVAQQLAIRHQQVEQPLEDLKSAWLEIVELSRNHVLMVRDSVRDNSAEDIASTAQDFANGYKRFVILVDDLILIRQSRNNQYQANRTELKQIIKTVEGLRRDALNQLDDYSYQFVNRQDRQKSQYMNDIIGLTSRANFYQYLYQELLKVDNKLTALSTAVTSRKFNQISNDVAHLTRNINKQLQEKSSNDALQGIQKDVLALTNQFMGSGQLFTKWRDENVTTEKVVEQLSVYQNFLKDTAQLIDRDSFFDLPEFSLNIPFLQITLKESTMLPAAIGFITILLTFSGYIAWKLYTVVTRSYYAGSQHMQIRYQKQRQAERLQKKQQEKNLFNELNREHEAPKNSATNAKPGAVGVNRDAVAAAAESIPESAESSWSPASDSFYKMNNLVMNLDKFNAYHGSAEVAVEMLDDYIERNQNHFKVLKTALANGDLIAAEQANKGLLHVANVLSSPRVIKVCEQVHRGLQNCDIKAVGKLLIEVDAALREVAEFVAES
ncbi:hypothetical protein [Thalassotalea maritima]|uniref:hypothetical protein n=1 Tax=Thalassotalea maritima TaxID=3242416 RepID=UPI00352784CE